MRTSLIAGLLALTPFACGQVVEFYGGDADGRNVLSSEQNGLITGGSWVFEDFDHRGGPITAVWGNFVTNYSMFESAWFEIRSGIAEGYGGTLHASGLLENPTFLATGRSYFGFAERYIKGEVTIPGLPAGTYYLGIQPRQTPAGRAFSVTTSATDLGPTGDPNPPPTGTPLRNGNAWFHSAFFGRRYERIEFEFGTYDFSYGVEIPEPSAAYLLALAALALLRRR